MLDSLHVLTLNQTARKVFLLSSHRLNHTSVPLIVGNQIYLTSLAGRTLASLWFHSFSVFTARTMWLLYSISILFLSRQVWLLICKVKQKNQSTRWHANLRGSGENKERKTWLFSDAALCCWVLTNTLVTSKMTSLSFICFQVDPCKWICLQWRLLCTLGFNSSNSIELLTAPVFELECSVCSVGIQFMYLKKSNLNLL